MRIELTEAVWLDERLHVSLTELATISGLTEAELRELVDYGALAPIDSRSAQWTFSSGCVVSMKTAGRLRRHFELEPNALALALSLMNRIRELEAQLQDLRTQQPRRRV